MADDRQIYYEPQADDRQTYYEPQRVDMAGIKIFVDKDDTATVLCPKCENLTIEDVSKYMETSDTVRVKYKCRCGYSFKIFLERREHFRKEVSVSGSYILKEENIRKPMTIINISCSGLKMELGLEEEINIGDRMVVEFCLDSNNKILIRKEVIIRYVQGSFIGAEFYTREPGNPFDKAYDMAIAYYSSN
ncbi:MAG: PilZ domain-containing protein [Desulfobacteraceae bacterium]|nr:PilZ domain-containing protein [Desulfobacteraceae bacterium]